MSANMQYAQAAALTIQLLILNILKQNIQSTNLLYALFFGTLIEKHILQNITTMKKNMLILMVAGTLAAFSANAQAPKKVKMNFKKLDTNKDGKISKAEVEALGNRSYLPVFDAIDVNNDGFATKKELKAYKKAHKGEIM